ncbi:linear amide C-N hydrolase [uncultured Ruminococcus sp.]|uniref:linear amide C-N hydrolase n=1 Tax=uncultured Ruminococcus sp. TaxID=165186 RepID=UPI0025EF6FE7|nr:linear amide C-N hydrolase [uncultured Ruminococcus sp.]
MNKVKKRILIVLVAILAVIVLAAVAFLGLYFTRIQTFSSIEQLTDYEDGYNLYSMDVQYDYNLDNIIDYGIKDDQTMIDAILKEALPLLPVKIEAPNFGCTAFSLTDTDGDVHMGRNYDFSKDTSAMLVYCAPKDGYKSIAFAALDNVSANVPDENIKTKMASLTAPFVCLDGMNEKGVSIAVLTLDSEPVHQNTGKPVISTTLAIRLVLDRAATTEEAVELLRSYDMFASSGRDYHFYINDASGDGRVIEYDINGEPRELIDTPSEAVTNFLIRYKDEVLPNQKNGIYGHGKERYDAVLKVLETEKGNYTGDTVWNAMKSAAQDPNPDDVTSNTQWSISYNNTDLTADIAIRRNWDDVTHCELENKVTTPEK